MQQLFHSSPLCWQLWSVTSTEMPSWARRLEAVDTKVVSMLCLCLTFKQLCYSSSMKREISCSPGTVSSSHCYGWQLQITNTFFFPFHLLHNSVFQLVCSSSIKQKIDPKVSLQLGVPYEVSHKFSQGQEMPWEHSHSCFGCYSN